MPAKIYDKFRRARFPAYNKSHSAARHIAPRKLLRQLRFVGANRQRTVVVGGRSIVAVRRCQCRADHGRQFLEIQWGTVARTPFDKTASSFFSSGGVARHSVTVGYLNISNGAATSDVLFSSMPGRDRVLSAEAPAGTHLSAGQQSRERPCGGKRSSTARPAFRLRWLAAMSSHDHHAATMGVRQGAQGPGPHGGGTLSSLRRLLTSVHNAGNFEVASGGSRPASRCRGGNPSIDSGGKVRAVTIRRRALSRSTVSSQA